MNHVAIFPAADPKRGLTCANAWMAKGYGVVMMVDFGGWLDLTTSEIPDDVIFYAYTNSAPEFAGYYQVINSIAAKAFKYGADLITAIGCDMLPPEQGAAEHSRLYAQRFGDDGFGVMQCIGDKQGTPEMCGVTKIPQHNAGRVCGSPTFGHGWFERAYGGRGPFCEDYGTFWADEDLQNVAHKLGVLYQESALTILHKHWSFGGAPREWWHEKASKTHWDKDKATFGRRKEQGFPGHDQKAVATNPH